MATNNIKIFDENKGNIMSTQEYSTNQQRLNGVQQGIASSMLQNKTLYQLSLVAYAIGQMMVNNGLDANDENAVSAFVGNLANTIVQKVVDKASTSEAQAGTDANKFMTPATTRAAINVLKATSGMATAGTDDVHWMTPALVKQVVDSYSNNFYNLIATQSLTTKNIKNDNDTLIFSQIDLFNICKNYSNIIIRMHTISSNPNTSQGNTGLNYFGVCKSGSTNVSSLFSDSFNRAYYLDPMHDFDGIINLITFGSTVIGTMQCALKCTNIRDSPNLFYATVGNSVYNISVYCDDISGYINDAGNVLGRNSYPIIFLSIPGTFTFKCDVYASKMLK